MKSGFDKSPDDFWDIDSLVPEKKEKRTDFAPRKKFDTSSVLIEASESGNDEKKISGSSFTRFIPPHTAREIEDAPKPEIEYKPQNSLIHNVKIYSTENKYNFYERFTDDARKYKDIKGEKSPQIPFFSYTPQYSQMNRDQLAYYFWWRENIRNNVYIDADYSYILLYLYELINLSLETDKQYTLDMMCNIWLNYGKEHVFISKYLGEWVCDFCLIHRLPVPSEKLQPLYPDIMEKCLIKEFYVDCNTQSACVSSVCAEALIEISSAYDYRKSRYATQERLSFMKKHFIGALNAVMMGDDDCKGIFDGIKSTIADNSAVRTAYSGALCSMRVRRKIEIDYYSFSKSYELRYLIADIMKYSENRMRKIWRIKSRLNIYALPTSIKKCIDQYFDHAVSPAEESFYKRKNDAEHSAEYEKMYEIPNTPLSVERAMQIEMESWNTTKILVESIEDEENANECVSNKTPERDLPVKEADHKATAFGERTDFLLAVLNEDIRSQNKIFSELSVPAEVLVDEINEIAADVIGDIIIEESDNGYKIIDDYRDIVAQMTEISK